MITTNDKAVDRSGRHSQGDYALLKKSLKEAMTGVAMMVATSQDIGQRSSDGCDGQ